MSRGADDRIQLATKMVNLTRAADAAAGGVVVVLRLLEREDGQAEGVGGDSGVEGLGD